MIFLTHISCFHNVACAYGLLHPFPVESKPVVAAFYRDDKRRINRKNDDPRESFLLFSMSTDDAPSDYDSTDLTPDTKTAVVDTNDADVYIRDDASFLFLY